MGHNERQSYLSAIKERYSKAKRADKTKILDEFCAVCGFNRKYAIRILKKERTVSKKRPGPKPVYQSDSLLAPLKKIWFTADQPCSRKLKVIIPDWLPHYESTYGQLPADVKEKLLSISRATIDRVLQPVRAKHKIKGRCTTKPGSLLKSKIPIQVGQWEVDKPGYLEADTVAHCGNSVAGKFAWSLTVTDICTGWTENRAIWNKLGVGVYQEISDIESILPFAILGFDSDNGGEFMNNSLYDYFVNRDKPVMFTRSRPYRKNDNAHVEQKNWTHVRQLFGYDRLDNKKTVRLMNDLYRSEWSLYQNHFIPAMKLIKKERIGSKYKKQYEQPKTPYERVIASPHIALSTKEELKKLHQNLNPFTLKKEIERKLDIIFGLVKVTSNVRQRI